MSEISLTVEGLSTGYRGRPVIHGIALPRLRAGEITALVGPNAAGKSTLLRALAGLLPARGRAALAERNLLKMTAAERAALIGFMPQTLPQGVGLTVLEGLLSSLNVGREPSGDDPVRQAVGVLERIGIADLALEPLYRLSGGQRQLASLAQSVVRQPPLLMLDEPISALDLHHQFEVMSMVRDYVSEGRIAIVVLHDLTFAARWADNVVVMTGGNLWGAGSPEAVITTDMLSSVYRVRTRVERCSRGFLHIAVDDLIVDSGHTDLTRRK